MTKEENKSSSCPDWAHKMILQLGEIEHFLGNVPKNPEWQEELLDKISKRSFAKDLATFDEAKAELVFKNIAQKLSDEGHTAKQISSYFNERIKYQEGPPYCNEEEVAEALQG